MKRSPDTAPDAAGRELGSATLTIPLAALGPLGPIQLPPPALVSSEMGADHVGLTCAALREHLGWMARHPRWRDSVIEVSRKRRLAAPCDVIASLRERYATPSKAANDDTSAGATGPRTGVDEVLDLLGAERVPQHAKRAP